MTDVQTDITPGGKAGLSPAWRLTTDLLAAVLTLAAIGWAMSVPRLLGVSYYPQQFFALILGLTLALAFLTLPARRLTDRTRVPWYDVVLAVIGFATMLYITVYYADLVLQVFSRPLGVWVPGLVALLLTLEALRRATGWALVIIIGIFVLYALFGDAIPGRLSARPQEIRMLSGYMGFDANGILGLPMSVAATIVVAFIFFGTLLNLTGGSDFFTDAAMLGMGRYRGGSMKIAVVASGLFGSISGSAVANVAGTGVVTIPMIKRDGYPPHKAGAIEAVASTGGQLMPPVMGAAAFLMAEFLSVSYTVIALSALIPALIYYIAVFIQTDLEAAKLGIQPIPKDKIPEGRTVRIGIHFVFAFAVLIYLLFWERYQPERAAIYAAVSLALTSVVFGYRGARPSPRRLLSSFAVTGHGVVEILLISAAAGIVIGVLNVTGLSFNLTYALVQVGGGSAIALLVLSAIVCIVLGMGLPTLGVYVLLAALVAPALTEVGIDPIAAHLYVLYFGMMSMITPPIALAAFAAAAIAKAPAMATGWASMRFGWAAYVVPFLFAFSPSLLMQGDWPEIAFAFLTAVVGVWLVSAGLAGYFAAGLSPLMRGAFIVAGLLTLVPAGMFDGAILSDVAGLAIGGGLMALEWRRGAREGLA